jgi:superfamily II DNA or RNA helicase
MPKYILYTLPDSAVNSVIDEIQKYNFPINYIIPLKSIKNKKIPNKFIIEDKNQILIQSKYTVTQKSNLKPYTINIIEHDHLRKCEQDFVPYMMDCIFIVDEVHKTLNETKRTSTALNLAHLSQKFIVFTGTPVIDNKIYKLIWWLEQIVDFEVTPNNFWVSANNIVARKITTGVHVNRDEIQAEFQPDESSEYQRYAPTSLGGSNKNTSIKDLQKITEICYRVCNRKMIDETLYFLNQNRGVMLVAKDKDHQQELKQLLIHSGLLEKDIFVMTNSESIFMTDENVKKKLVHDYKVVIVPISKPEGYTLTRLSVMISSVYPSNQAKREQIEGRINRIGQSQKEIYYRIIHTGVLSFILRNHNSAKSLKDALYDLAKNIDVEF